MTGPLGAQLELLLDDLALRVLVPARGVEDDHRRGIVVRAEPVECVEPALSDRVHLRTKWIASTRGVEATSAEPAPGTDITANTTPRTSTSFSFIRHAAVTGLSVRPEKRNRIAGSESAEARQRCSQLEPVEDLDEQLESVALDEAGPRPRRLRRR